MCGIFCSLNGTSCYENKHSQVVLETCLVNLQSRGPDHYQSVQHKLPSGHSIILAASVLQTQGSELCLQPFTCQGSTLCWNGDIFDGPLVDEIHNGQLSDTEVVTKHFSECLSQGLSPSSVFNKISGPYSFILYDEWTQTIWFGRDPAGRHSLLCGFTEEPFNFTLTSVAHSTLTNFKEVPAIGLFQINLGDVKNEHDLHISFHPWDEIDSDQLKEFCEGFPVKCNVRPPACDHYIFRPSSFTQMEPDTEEFYEVFQSLLMEDKMNALANLGTFHENTMKVLSLLESAVKVRVQTNITSCQNCISDHKSSMNPCYHSKVAILFSGGLDSAILARLADKFVSENEPIDLLNVAFEKKKVCCSPMKGKRNNVEASTAGSLEGSTDVLYNVPDRLSGRRTLKELEDLCPSRKWNFVEINVPATELQEERVKSIGHLIHPLKTVLDDSLGCALWFAARGKGEIVDSNQVYTSPARIIITGMGADEQFGGYMRHRTTLKHHGWEALCRQLQLELRRIPSRNLGRDDRVISHHGRQPRMPFLDEEVVNFVKSLPPWERCRPTEQFPCGIGDKLLLRLVAWHIGLHGAALLPKRAMQFGSRIANSKENAADTSNRL